MHKQKNTSRLGNQKVLERRMPIRNTMETQYPEIGICGLSCRLCPRHGKMGCRCRSLAHQSGHWCSFVLCAKENGVEFCWDCKENKKCPKWNKKREFGKAHDSFKCYQKLEDDIAFIHCNGIEAFEGTQKRKGQILDEMLKEFDEGRSKNYYCLAATILDLGELEDALKRIRKASMGLDARSKSNALHSVLDEIATRKKYLLKLRK